MGDTYEPGAPSLRAMLPSMVGGAVVPLVTYHLVRAHVGSDAVALAWAGVPAAGYVLARLARTRRVDPIGALMLAGFAVGVAASLALGGDAFVLKIRESAFTVVFGALCLVSLRAARPMMFHIGKALSAGDDPDRRAAYDRLLDSEHGRQAFRTITAVWGCGLVAECAVRVALAVSLSTSLFLVVTPAIQFACFCAMFGFTVAWARRGRRRVEADGLVYPSVPAAAAGA
ncbi:MAG TPA: VC0807 family protein [Acidimicrobiales bacterium]|nr:VC0807 family protein [Acidimicrobiales bacterium]